MTQGKDQGKPAAEASGQAQVRDTGGPVLGGGELGDTGAPLMGDLDGAGGIIGKPEADKPVVEGGGLLIDQDLAGRFIGDRDLDILIVEFPRQVVRLW